ncbi:hypothetical protein EUX98_g6847 [Antrodiella citrinella]|uniref:Integrase catalytic domain-containing protein n=1 Tax=Antrodiella citrinella TaxID=2447956 RepID=A0A4S4MVF3_9APHY|nr:hypothetical protein EUX98_g6847 [Antrodiella citrinella]
MILMNKIPQKWDTITTVLMQSEKKDINFDFVAKALTVRWDQASKGDPSIQKLSAVKRKKDDPSFKQQYQHRSAPAGNGGQSNQGNSGNSGNGRKRGKRGGKGKEKAAHAIISSAEAPLLAARLTPSVPSPQVMVRASHTYGKPNQYPKFKKAIKLAHELDVARTPETLRTLEKVYDDPPVASGSIVTLDDDDDRASKRARTDDEEEPLDWGSDVDEEIANAAGFDDDKYSGQVLSLYNPISATDAIDLTETCRRLSSVLECNVVNECHHLLDSAKCALCKGKGKPQNKKSIVERQQHSWLEGTWWLMDSGASLHCTNQIDDFIDYEKLPVKIPIKTASTTKIYMIRVGSVAIRHPVLQNNGTYVHQVSRVFPVYHCPEMIGRILSMGTFIQDDLIVRSDSRHIALYQRNLELPIIDCFPRQANDTLYIVPDYSVDDGTFELNPVVFAVDFGIMHRCLGHPSKDVLQRAKVHTKGFPPNLSFPKESPICRGCAEGKMKLQSFPPSRTRASKPFEKIHSDLKSLPVESYHRNKYFIIFYDDYTSNGWIIFLREKSGAITATRQFIAMVKNQYKTTIKEWMSDAGGEYKSDEFLKMLADLGIKVLQSAPNMHQQNRRAERWIQTIMDKAEPMRFDTCLPPSWWEFAVGHAVHVYNRTPMKRLEWWTPHELLTGDVPDISHLRVFGCGAYIYLPKEVRLNKLSPKSELMIYLGVAEGIKGFKFMRQPNNVIFTAITAMFDEEMFPRCPDQRRRNTTRIGQDNQPADIPLDIPPEVDADDDDDAPAPRPHHTHHLPQRDEGRDHDGNHDGAAAPNPPPPPPPPEEPPAPQPRRSGREQRPVYRPGNVYGERRNPVDQFKDVERMGKWKEIVGEQPSSSRNAPQSIQDKVPGPNLDHPNPARDNAAPSEDEVEDILARLCREGGVELIDLLLAKAIPQRELLPDESNVREWTFRDISKLPKKEQEEWRHACREELEALHKRKVFELVNLPEGRKVIRNHWVFDVKSDGRKKARLVAKGFSQVEGVDFDQIFSPVVRFETVRLVLALATLEDWHVSGVDVKSAYLYGKLDEEIYMEQPEGFKVKGQERKVLRLLRALYGLKQAGLAWWRVRT